MGISISPLFGQDSILTGQNYSYCWKIITFLTTATHTSSADWQQRGETRIWETHTPKFEREHYVANLKFQLGTATDSCEPFDFEESIRHFLSQAGV